MNWLQWLAVAGSIIGLVLIFYVGYLVLSFCHGWLLVEQKHWMEDDDDHSAV